MNRFATFLIVIVAAFAGSQIGYSQWVPTNIGSSGMSTTKLFTLHANNGVLFTGGYNGLWRSTDLGVTWQNFPYESSAFAFNGDTIASAEAGFPSPTMHFSTDNGATWELDAEAPDSYMASLCFIGDTLFAAPVGGEEGLFRTESLGKSWDTLTEPPGAAINTLAVFGDTLFAGTSTGIYFTPNDSALNNSTGIDSLRWEFAGIPSEEFISFLCSGNLFLALANSGDLYRSRDSGRSWAIASNSVLPVGFSQGPMANIGNKLFLGTDSEIFLSRDSGVSSIQVNIGLPQSASIAGLAILGQYVFAAVVSNIGADIYRRPLSDFDAGVNKVESTNLELSVSISPEGEREVLYTVPFSGTAEILLYDELGRRVESFQNEVRAGTPYSLPLSNIGTSERMYFCKISFQNLSKVIATPIQ